MRRIGTHLLFQTLAPIVSSDLGLVIEGVTRYWIICYQNRGGPIPKELWKKAVCSSYAHPFIYNDDSGVKFSAWEYAKRRCMGYSV